MFLGYEFDLKIKHGQSNQDDFFTDSLSLPSIDPFLIAGVDEAGRGPLAGPVVAAAVILPENPRIEGLNDSKKLSERQRGALAEEIKKVALAFGVAIVDNHTIDEINILAASLKAMRIAVSELAIRPHLVLVDGNQKSGCEVREATIIKGDALSASIMAASILAKVTRDQLMVEAHKKFPEYGFNGHKGYGAKSHIEAIERHGPCPIHRMSFEPIRTLIKKEQTLSI